MVKVIFVKNPFSPSRDRVVKLSEATDKPLSFYIDEFVNQLPKNEAYIEIDGRKVPAEYLDTCNEIIKPNSFIVVMPKIAKGGGKSILGLVAVIALSVVSFGVGGLASGAGMWGAGMGAWTFGGYLAAAAVMFLGGSLISKFMAPKIDTGKYQTEDPTYSWNGVHTMDAQGNGIAITYGKVKSGGQSLQKFTTNDGDDQYFNWLVSAGEGPLTISDIKLNNNPIGNYESVSYQIREGSNNQSIISGFGDTYVNKSVSYEINNDEWRTDEVDSNAAQGIVIELECSQGLYHANNNGSLGTAWIEVTAQYALSGSGNWVTFVNNVRISGAKSGVVRKQFRVDNLASGKYQVRVTVNSRSANVNSSRDGVKIWWTQCNAIIYDDFSYPNTALIGIKAKATSQLSGSTPQLTFLKERAAVWVWNPNVGDYEQKAANNPAWAAYDFIHGAKRLYDIRTNKYEMIYDGVPKELMLYDQFEAWATNCDNMNLKINIEIVTVSDFWTIVNQDIAPIGRGLVVQFGTKFGCIYDHASQPVQLFNMGNIIQGSFEHSYLGAEDRADVLEITYFDADNDYEKSVITIYADDYDAIDIPNQPTQLTYNGITSYEQAYREGKYQLFCNKLLQETITFKADVEAISCQVGDQILVSHDVPQWSFSGRVDKVNADGSVVVGLDIEEIAIPEGETWGIMVRNSTDNTLTTYTVAEVSGKYGEVRVKATSSIKANEGDLFSLGRINSVVKPFVVKSLQKSGDLEYTISALEYVEGVYSEDYTIPEPNYSLADAPITQVTNLEISANSYTNDGGNPAKTLYLTWDGTGVANIYLSSDNGETYYLAASTSKNNAAIEVDPFVDYKVKVLTSNKTSETTPVIQDVKSNVGQFLPPKATNFVLQDGRWSWEYEDSNWVDYFELRLDTNCGRETNLLERTFVPYSLKMPNISSGTAYLYIRNRLGQYNEPATFAFAINAPAAPTSAPVLTATADGVVVDMVALPRGCTGYKVHVVTDDGVDAIFNVSTQRWVYYKYSGTITVSYCIVNEITDGVYSPTATTTIRDIEPADGSITSEKLAANAVTAGKIAANAVTTDNIAAGAVTAEKAYFETLRSVAAKIGEYSSGEPGTDRVVITDSVIKVIDSNDIARIELGLIEE